MPGKAKGKPFVKKDPRAGRPKGVKNKFTTLKEAFVNAFQSVGGEDYLVKFAKAQPLADENEIALQNAYKFVKTTKEELKLREDNNN